MSAFILKSGGLNIDLLSLYGTKTQLYTTRAELAVQLLRLRMSGSSSAVSALRNRLSCSSKRIGNEITNLNSLINTGNTICSKAKTAENSAMLEMSGLLDIIKVTWPFVGGVVPIIPINKTIMPGVEVIAAKISGAQVSKSGKISADFWDGANAEGKWSVSAISGKTSGSFAGGDGKYYAAGTIGTITATGTAGASLFDKDGNLNPNFNAEGKVEAHAITGEAGASYDNGTVSAGVNAKGSVGNARAQGKVSGSIFDKDGNLNPNITVEGKAGANVAEGEVSAHVGTKHVSADAKAEGSVLGAEAEGKVTASKDGVHAKGSAMAYAAKGTASGSINIFGVKITGSVSGIAGGVGVSGEVGASKTGATVGLGGALALGGEGKVSIDWSGCPLYKAVSKIKMPSAKDAGKFITGLFKR
ncbi:MAG: hypothetical protein J5929_01180 [Eubacterium sp.]|nr:hypothetical protein [Eubacterium sp.]